MMSVDDTNAPCHPSEDERYQELLDTRASFRSIKAVAIGELERIDGLLAAYEPVVREA